MKRSTAKPPAAGAEQDSPKTTAVGERFVASSKKLRVGLLFGGRSVEHEISILSARSIARALDPRRYEIVPIGIDKAGTWKLQDKKVLGSAEKDPKKLALLAAGDAMVLPPYPETGNGSGVKSSAASLRTLGGGAATERLDVVFPVLHGTFGEDGTVQGLLELAGVPYVGSGVLGSAIGMDKDLQKRLLRDAGLPVTRFRTVRASEWRQDRASVLSMLSKRCTLPLFVKPANAGSSVGVSKVKTAEEISPALDLALEFDEKALVEEAIFGREIECAVLGDEDPKASVPGEVIPKGEYYSYEAKYLDPEGAELIVPAVMKGPETMFVQRLAVDAFRALDLSGMARVDFFIAGNGGKIYVNEVNTIPGFTSISMYPRMWEASGISYPELVERLIDLAIRRHARRAKLKTTLY